MASGPITSWEIDGETVSDFIFLGSKITTDGDCSHEIKHLEQRLEFQKYNVKEKKKKKKQERKKEKKKKKTRSQKL